MDIGPTSGRAGDICIGCGLCCGGALLSHVALCDETDLRLPLRALGVEVIVSTEPPCFELPCPALHEGVCTVYAHRPAACREFECSLLRRVQVGEVSELVARRVIEEALALRDLSDPDFEPYVERWFGSATTKD